MIILNTIAIGLESTYDVQWACESYDLGNATEQKTHWWLGASEEFFFGFYVSELAVRILAYEGLFFVGPDWQWNCFDTLVVRAVSP